MVKRKRALACSRLNPRFSVCSHCVLWDSSEGTARRSMATWISCLFRTSCAFPLALLLGLAVFQEVAVQPVSDVPLPKRCHLAAPCNKRSGCQANVDSKERWVVGGSQVQLAVVCNSIGGSHEYGKGGFFTYTVWPEGSSKAMFNGKFNQYDMALNAHLTPLVRSSLNSMT